MARTGEKNRQTEGEVTRRVPVRQWVDKAKRQQMRGAAQQEPHLDERYFRALIDNSSDAVVVLNDDVTIRYESPSMKRLLGYVAGERTRQVGFDFVHPDDMTEAAQAFAELIANPGSTVQLEVRGLHRDGSWRNLEVVCSNLAENPAVAGIVVNMRDITERKQAERVAEAAHAELDQIFHTSGAAMRLTDTDFNVLRVNKTFSALFGLSSDEAVGRECYEVHPGPSCHTDDCPMTRILRGDERVEYDVEKRRPDGTTVSCWLVATPFRSLDGGLIGIVESFMDITERKQAEQALRESELEYSLLVGNLTDAVFRYKDGAIVWSNDRIQEMLGYDEGEMIGEDVNLFVPDDVDLAALMERVEVQLKEEGHFTGATRAKKKDGSTIEIEYTAAEVPGKDPVELVGVARDVTGRKQAEAVLRESEEKYRELVNTSADGVISVDAGMKIVLWNRRAQEIFGYSEDEILGQSLYKIIPQRYREAKRKGTRLYARTGTGPLLGRTTEIGGLRKDGTEVPVELSMSSRKIGDTYVATALIRDITERRRVDEELRARTHALGERVKEQICLNEVLSKAGEPGISLEEVLERTLDLIPPGWQYPEITCARVTLAGQKYTTDNFAETPWMLTSDIVTDGERTGSVEVYYREERPELDEGPFFKEERAILDAIAALLGGIIERRQTEKTLEESERKLRQIFESVNDEIIFADPSGVIIDANERTRTISGYAPDEVIGRSVFDLDIFDQDDASRIAEMISVSVRGGSPAVPLLELKVKHKDGHMVPVEVNTSIMAGAEGGIAGFVSVIRDITERKWAEEERERLAAELAEKNKELEHIVYVSSHDLRSPLVNVQGFSKELDYSLQELISILQHEEISPEVREKLAPIIETDIADSLTYIQASVLKMDSLLNGLLRLSRLGRAALNVETLNLDEMVSEIMKTNEYSIKSARVKVEIGDLPPCVGDSVQINQVFSNLVDNALKYLDPGRPGAIRVTGSVNGDCSVYCVEDNGVGIAGKDLERVFEIFKQLNPGASTGEGLGLAVVRKVLGRNNGRIWVESELGVGSKFFVSLPAANQNERGGAE